MLRSFTFQPLAMMLILAQSPRLLLRLTEPENLASPGDTMYLRGGTYTATRYIYGDKDGLTISSYPGGRAVIVGSSTDVTNLVYVIFLLANNQTLMNLKIQGGS